MDVPKTSVMNGRWWNSAVKVGIGTGVVAAAASLFVGNVVTASQEGPGLGCPGRTAEMAANIHYSMHGVYPSTLDQLSDDGFTPPNPSPDGLTAHSDSWSLRMVPGTPPVFSCD